MTECHNNCRQIYKEVNKGYKSFLEALGPTENVLRSYGCNIKGHYIKDDRYIFE